MVIFVYILSEGSFYSMMKEQVRGKYSTYWLFSQEMAEFNNSW